MENQEEQAFKHSFAKNDDIHDQILKAFRVYFEANQDWHTKSTLRAGMQARNALMEIKHLCSAQRAYIMDWRREFNVAYALRNAQNRKEIGANNDN